LFPAEKRARFEESHFWYRARRRIITTLLESLGLAPSSRILEIGCGCGSNLREIRTHFDSYGGDSDLTACRLANQKIPGRIAAFDAHRLPFADSVFNAVLALDTLEHLADDVAALREAHRVLAREGLAIVTVPSFPALWWRHDIAEEHRRRYTKKSLTDTAHKAGFRVDKLTHFNAALFLPIATMRLLGKTLLSTRGALDFREVPQPINDFLIALFAFERHLIIPGSLPFGLSLLAIFRKF
jgi:ubiquinone/menaquinone biosynthesis C-methylase UbiE